MRDALEESNDSNGMVCLSLAWGHIHVQQGVMVTPIPALFTFNKKLRTELLLTKFSPPLHALRGLFDRHTKIVVKPPLPPQSFTLSTPALRPTSPTIRTKPLPNRLPRNCYTAPMEPFIWTIIIIASNHIPITYTMTYTVLLIISLSLIIPFFHLHILIIFIPHHAIVIPSGR